MAQPSPLAKFVARRVKESGSSPEPFAEANGFNASGFYKFLRGDVAEPRKRILEKIATGLGYASALELRRAAEPTDDLLESQLLERMSEMREAVEGIPLGMRGTIIKSTFDWTIDAIRNMARMLASAPTVVSATETSAVRDTRHASNVAEPAQTHDLNARQRLRLGAPSILSLAR